MRHARTGVLGDSRKFSKHFQTPILAGREPFATEDEQKLGTIQHFISAVSPQLWDFFFVRLLPLRAYTGILPIPFFRFVRLLLTLFFERKK